jgi:hypothetical protein
MKKIILLALGIVIIASSCTKLEEEVYDKIPGDQYPENDAQVANLAVSAYAQMVSYADDGNDDEGGWWFLAQIMTGDLVCGPTRGADWFDGGKWVNMHTHEWTSDNEGVTRMWIAFWNGITTCNSTLDMMRGLESSETVDIKI